MRKNHSKKIAKAALRSTLMLSAALAFLAAFFLIDTLSQPIYRRQSALSAEIGQLANRQSLVEQSLEADSRSVEALLFGEEVAASLQNWGERLQNESFWTRLMLGEAGELVPQIEGVGEQYHALEVSLKGLSELPLPKKAEVADSTAYANLLIETEQQRASMLDRVYEQASQLQTAIGAAQASITQRTERMESRLLVLRITFGALAALFLFLTLVYIRRWVFNPLRKVVEQTYSISEGDLAAKVELKQSGAVSEMKEGVNRLVDNMRTAAEFAYSVGEGNLEAHLDLVHDENTAEPQANLAYALVHMRDRLKEFSEDDQKRKWAAEGLAYFVEILRAEHSNLESMGQQIISGLVNYLSANQGAIYVLEETEDGQKIVRGLAAFAWGYPHQLKSSFAMDEGLIGSAVSNNRTIYMTDLPEDYAYIRSGLGDAQPRNILITPLCINETVVGAIELASFEVLRDFEVEFIKKVSENIATSINGVQTALKTQALLVQSQELAQQLKDQEQQVRNNLKELESTQERMIANQMELDGVLSAIDKSMAMAEFNLNGKLVEANSSFLKLTGYRLSEIRGRSHEELVPLTDAAQEQARELWESLRKGRFRQGEFNRINSKGQEIWIHASYNPILGADAKPQKILLLAADITDQKLAALDYEGQIHAINQTNAVAEFDLEGNFLNVNPLYTEMTGYAEADLLNNHHRMVVPAGKAAASEYLNLWTNLKKGQTQEGEFNLRTQNGKEIWVRGSYNPILDLEGKPMKVVSVAVDITTQKQMEMQIKEQLEHMAAQEEELRQNMEEMTATHEEMQATHEEMDRNQVEMSGILSSIDKSMAMIEYDMEGKTLSANNSFLELTGYSLEELEGRAHEIFLLDSEKDTAESQAFWEALKRGDFRQGTYKRVAKDGSELWLSSVYNPIPGRDGVPYKILQFATDVTESMQASLDYEGQINAINKSFLMAVFAMDRRVIEANQLFVDMVGASRAALLDRSHASFLPKEAQSDEQYEDLWERLNQGEFVNGEFSVVTGDGEVKWVRGSYNPILDLNGEPYKVVWVSVEISEEKEMASRIQEQLGQMASQEEELRNSFAQMQQTKELLEQRELEMSGQLHAIDSTLATVEYSPEGLILGANDIFLSVTGYNEAEIKEKPHSIFVEEEVKESLEYKQIWRNLQQGISQSGEYKYLTADEQEIWMFSTKTPVLGRDGKPFKVIELATEITDRKLMTLDFEGQVAAINRSNAVAEFSLEGELKDANESFLSMIREKLEDLQGRQYARLVPDEKQEEAQGIWEKLATGNYVEGEFEWNRNSELPLWVKATFNPILDLDGNPFKVVLIANDITQEKMLQLENSSNINMLALKEMELRKNMRKMKEAQEQLSRSEAEIRGQLNAIDSTNAKLEYDLEGKISSVNELFLNLAGYTEEEVLGQPYTQLLFEEEAEGNDEEKKDGWEKLRAGETISGEFRFRKKEGEVLWMQATFTPILDEEGQPYKVLSLATDITERKRSEAEIVEANEKLNATLTELTTAQDRLILSEKMASLGQLIAGVAHEVNTPISAVKASVRNMARILPHALRELPGLMANVEDETATIFSELVEKSVSSDVTLTTKEERKYKKEIQAYLDEIGIEDSYEIASSLVSIRVLDGIDRFLPLIEREEANVFLDMAYRLGQLKVNMDNIDTAAEKTSKIVFALKSYTHVQSADKFVMTPLSESLDLILTVYQNQLKYGVEITRNYEEIPPVPVYPDELGQVWTNIIHNAIQAMKNEGKLTLDIGRESDMAVVRITDSGPGIPEEIKQRIFEPFFTTKDQGEGTGLGLDICAKIIEKHGGKIEVDSEPGRTTFIVRLPFEQPEPLEEEDETSEAGANGHEVAEEKELVKVG